MNIQLSQSEFCLSKRQTLSFVDAAAVRIDALAGAVWVTQDHDRRDVVLSQGESLTVARNARTIVQAFEPSRVSLSQPAAAAPRDRGIKWAARLRHWLGRSLPQLAWD